MKVLVAQSCPTLWDPMNCSLPGSSAHGIFQARILKCSHILSLKYTLIFLQYYFNDFITVNCTDDLFIIYKLDMSQNGSLTFLYIKTFPWCHTWFTPHRQSSWCLVLLTTFLILSLPFSFNYQSPSTHSDSLWGVNQVWHQGKVYFYTFQ